VAPEPWALVEQQPIDDRGPASLPELPPEDGGLLPRYFERRASLASIEHGALPEDALHKAVVPRGDAGRRDAHPEHRGYPGQVPTADVRHASAGDRRPWHRRLLHRVPDPVALLRLERKVMSEEVEWMQ